MFLEGDGATDEGHLIALRHGRVNGATELELEGGEREARVGDAFRVLHDEGHAADPAVAVGIDMGMGERGRGVAEGVRRRREPVVDVDGGFLVRRAEARARRNRYRRSILDFVAEDTRSLQSKLGPTDNRKLDEFLSSIRDIERQIERAEKDNAQIDPGMEKPYGVPADFAEHFKLMTDMITVAFQADLTRVLTFLVTREGTSRPYREIGIADGHHPLTHHRNDPAMKEKVAQINEYHVRQFAAWIEKLKSIREGDSTLLDNSMIVYGAGLADGNRHTHEDLPTIILGRAGNAIKPGRRIITRKETPMSNLFLTMMDIMGVHVEHFGDSTGRLQGLDLS
jgi:hypothetical protein